MSNAGSLSDGMQKLQSEPAIWDEPDFSKHVGNVLSDYRDGLLDGIEEAVEAIVEHPAVKDLLGLKVIRPLEP